MDGLSNLSIGQVAAIFPAPRHDRSEPLTVDSVRGAARCQTPTDDHHAWIAINAIRALSMDAVEAAQSGVRARVVSLPSWELFEAQPATYRDSVLPPGIRARVGIEAASAFGWERYLTDDGAMLAMDGFGASAPGERLFQEFKFTPARAADLVREVLSRRDA